MTYPFCYTTESNKRTFKSTYQIMQGISKVWDDINDINRSNFKGADRQYGNVLYQTYLIAA